MKIWGLDMREKFSRFAATADASVEEEDEDRSSIAATGEFGPDVLQLEKEKAHALLAPYARNGRAFIPDHGMAAPDIDETDIYADDKPVTGVAAVFARVMDTVSVMGSRLSFPGYVNATQFLPPSRLKR